MWFSGLTVAVKVYHHRNIKLKHIQMEAKMLQVNCLLAMLTASIVSIICMQVTSSDFGDMSIVLDFNLQLVSTCTCTSSCQQF